MSSITKSTASELAPHGVELPFVATRIDAPHVVASPLETPPASDALGTELDELARLVEPDPEREQDQLRLQASQLAEFLRGKQQELDHRESVLNAGLSQLDKERRAFRLQQREHDEEHARLDSEHRKRLSELDVRVADISSAELALSADESDIEVRWAQCLRVADERRQENERRSEDLLQQATALEAARRELAREQLTAQEELGRQREQLAADRAAHDREYEELLRNLDQNRRELENRRREVDEQSEQQIEDHQAQARSELSAEQLKLRAKINQCETLETLLQESWSYCERQRRELDTERAKLESSAQEQQRAISDQRRKAEESARLAELQVRQREELVAKRVAAVDQTRTDLVRVHHETLEMRIILEQLWSQLADRMDGAELTRSIAASRARLTDEYRLASQTLAEQQRELQELSRRLTDHQSKLRRQRTEVQEWLARRNQELHERETRIAVREEQLARSDRQLAELQQQLEQERRSSQQRLRELATQIGLKLGWRLQKEVSNRNSLLLLPTA